MKRLITIGKFITLGVWGLLLYNLYHPFESPVNDVLTTLFLALVLIHQFESLLFMNKYRQSQKPLLIHALQVFLFGIFHMMAVKDDLKKGE